MTADGEEEASKMDGVAKSQMKSYVVKGRIQARSPLSVPPIASSFVVVIDGRYG